MRAHSPATSVSHPTQLPGTQAGSQPLLLPHRPGPLAPGSPDNHFKAFGGPEMSPGSHRPVRNGHFWYFLGIPQVLS